MSKDKHGRLWGHEWEVVAWMALSTYHAREDFQAYIDGLGQSFVVSCVTESLRSSHKSERTVWDGLK